MFTVVPNKHSEKGSTAASASSGSFLPAAVPLSPHPGLARQVTGTPCCCQLQKAQNQQSECVMMWLGSAASYCSGFLLPHFPLHLVLPSISCRTSGVPSLRCTLCITLECLVRHPLCPIAAPELSSSAAALSDALFQVQAHTPTG